VSGVLQLDDGSLHRSQKLLVLPFHIFVVLVIDVV
jgi:hypothetical protein